MNRGKPNAIKPRLMLLGAAVLLILTAVASVGFASMSYEGKIDSLHRQLGQERNQASAHSAQGHAETQQLLDVLLELNDQAAVAEKKLKELEQLERELRRLSLALNAVPAWPVDGSAALGGGFFEASEAVSGRKNLSSTAELLNQRYDQLMMRADQMTTRYHSLVQSYSMLEERARYIPSIWPADSRVLNSLYGLRRDPFTNRSAYHHGIDIEGETGDPVYSTADGVVATAERDPVYGNHIVIDHIGGTDIDISGRSLTDRTATAQGQAQAPQLSTVYMHLSKLLVKPGDWVTKGQLIGKIGTTGRSTGSHLHYEVHYNGEPINPKSYLP